MPQLLQPTRIITKDGELIVHLMIDLNINVNTTGTGITVATSQGSQNEKEKEKDPEWELPTFGPAPKIKFGKTEEEGK